jgi:hypothetical protein
MMEYTDKIQQLREIIGSRCHLEIVPELLNSSDYRSKIYYEFDWTHSFDDSLKAQMKMVKNVIAKILQLTAIFPRLFKHVNIFSKVGLWIKMNQMGEIMIKWIFFYTPNQFRNIHDLVNNWLTSWKDFYSYHTNHLIVSIHYQIENLDERGKIPTKNKHYYFWWGVPKLRESIGDFIYFISPDRFTQVNWYTQKVFYDLLLREIQYITPIIPHSAHVYSYPRNQYTILSNDIVPAMKERVLFCFGRDIGAITQLFAPYVQSICGFTYCPIVYKDCIQNWAEYADKHGSLQEKAIYQYTTRAKLYKLFPQPFTYPKNEITSYILVWSSGRHGLKIDELRWMKHFASTQNIESMVYISCNLKTLRRDLGWISENMGRRMRIRKIYTINQFPGTEYIETHVWWNFMK